MAIFNSYVKLPEGIVPMCQARVWSIRRITLLRKDPQDGMEHHNPFLMC